MQNNKDTIAVYRGLSYSQDSGDYKMRNLTSWSLEPAVARSFAEEFAGKGNEGSVIKAEIPIKDILLDSRVLGKATEHWNEAEILVKGGKSTKVEKVPNDIKKFEKGGPGSGNFGHAGRPGKRGGSSKGKGSISVKEVVKHARDRGIELDKKVVSPMLQDLSSKYDAPLEGFEFRIKSEGSLERKVEQKVKTTHISPTKAVGNITDITRYTLILDREPFVDKAINIQREMEQNGWVRWDHKWKNYFRKGGAYEGYNTVIWNPKTGQKFELQYHTQESFNIKMEAHLIYEKMRVLSAGSPEAIELQRRNIEMWQDFKEPDGWENLPGRIMEE